MIMINNYIYISTRKKWHNCKLAGITYSQKSPNTEHAFVVIVGVLLPWENSCLSRSLKVYLFLMHKCINHITF